MSHEKSPSAFGKKLKVAREAKGMSMRQLAKAATVSGSYPSHIECGEIADPGTEIAGRLATALGMTLDELLAVEIPDAGSIATTGHDVGPGVAAGAK